MYGAHSQSVSVDTHLTGDRVYVCHVIGLESRNLGQLCTYFARSQQFVTAVSLRSTH
jgi:hypothetical protein